MKKLFRSMVLATTLATPLFASLVVEERVPLTTFVNLVETNARSCRAVGKSYEYTGETMDAAKRLADMTSIPFGERYDLLARLVVLGKEFNLNDCLLHSVPDALLLSYTKTPNATPGEVLKFLNLCMTLVSELPDLFLKKSGWEILELNNYVVQQAKNGALDSKHREGFAEFFKIHSPTSNKMEVYYRLLSGI